MASGLAAAVPAGLAAVLQHDSYYRQRSDLAFEQRSLLNFDHPDSLESELLVEHLKRLQCGEVVEVPIYDFKTHLRLAETRRVVPAPVIIVEGILVFSEEKLRELFDMKVFVDTDPDIRVLRRIRRDIEQRGRSFQSIREHYYASVRPMHLQFVEPSKRWADVIIPEGGQNQVALDLLVHRVRAEVARHG